MLGLRTILKRRGLGKGCRPTDTRQTLGRDFSPVLAVVPRTHPMFGDDQIQFLLGHVSIQTTERYLGRKQKLRDVVNDRLGVEPHENG